jgi:hypothetical protein
MEDLSGQIIKTYELQERIGIGLSRLSKINWQRSGYQDYFARLCQ